MKNRFIILKILVAICLLVFLFLKIDIQSFLSYLKNANLILVVISALMAYFGVYLSIIKWNIFLKNYEIKINKLKLYSLYSISTFLNNFLPTSIGGDVYRSLHLNKNTNFDKKEIVSSIILERGSGFLSLFFLNFLIAPFYWNLIYLHKSFLLIEFSILVLFIIVTLFIIYNKSLINLKDKFIKKDIKIISKFVNLIKSLFEIKNKNTIIFGLLYSLVFSLAVATSRYILFYSFSLDVDFWYILLVSCITQIFGLIPISFNSIGITEGLNIFFFALIGVPMEISLAVALIGRISLIFTSSLGGLFYFFDKKIKY